MSVDLELPPGVADPLSNVGSETDRGVDGRFKPGNSAALVAGAHSPAFWRAQDAVRRDIEQQVIADMGYAPDDAPRTVRLAASSLAQAVLVQASAFERIVESGGPLTSKGRSRRAFTIWLQASDRLERYLRLVGLKRTEKHVDLARSLSGLDDGDGR